MMWGYNRRCKGMSIFSIGSGAFVVFFLVLVGFLEEALEFVPAFLCGREVTPFAAVNVKDSGALD